MLGHGMVSVNMALQWPWSSWRMAMTCHGCRSPSKLGPGPGHRPFPGRPKSHRKWRTSHFWAKVDGKVVACWWVNWFVTEKTFDIENYDEIDEIDWFLILLMSCSKSIRLMVSPIMVAVLLIIQLCIYIYTLYIIHLLWWCVLIRFGSPSGQEALPALKKPCFPTKAPVPATSFPVTAGKSAPVAKNFMLRRLNAAALAGRGYGSIRRHERWDPWFLGGSNSRSKSMVMKKKSRK